MGFPNLVDHVIDVAMQAFEKAVPLLFYIFLQTLLLLTSRFQESHKWIHRGGCLSDDSRLLTYTYHTWVFLSLPNLIEDWR